MENHNKSQLPLEELVLQEGYESLLAVMPLRYRQNIEKRLVREFNQSVDDLFDQ